MDYTMLLFFGLAILIFGSAILMEKINEKKDIEIELQLRKSDSLLGKYYTEMTSDQNDGWWKLHYKQKYEQRLNRLKKK